ncbi:MAG: family 78 glycoside hydrolase catalytic domain [Candidatus Pedobacter colombiensis]|uniref:alpha-L-rhamnosidase n=1 Tax=Candidatus Pedobacter colombiensis TaxID=3121371 RepID=A0AAJ5W5K8_9SPHI|nr:alpha-L-rhamnosidase [Pedobacter sp.]WEK17696.1 MAG: family 78 glycoside hydrolase catalytic domain [Pedobacter sp.]
MKLKRYILLAAILMLSFTGAFAQISLQNLRCELLQNPLGIDVVKPRLSWEITSVQRDVRQTAYHILVASSVDKLTENDADIWNSGRVNSSESIYNQYAGPALKSKNKYYWKVKVSTNKGETSWSKPASWLMGLLYYKDWEARWIGFDRFFPWDNENEDRLSARYFRKEFSTDKTVASATAYIMGMGLYEMYIDGKKIGDQVLAPAPTDYTKNIKYNALDVTKQLKQGKHAIGVILGNGRFFAMRQAKAYKVKTFGFPKLLLQVVIKYTDGSTVLIKTDDSWKGTADGPILANNEYDGEVYDARKEFKGWTEPGFNENKWLQAEYVQEPGGTYEAQLSEAMKVMKNIAPISVNKRPNGKYILDFGQNFAGWVKFNVKGPKGTVVSLRFAESLEPNGELFRTNLRDAKATDSYTLKGEGTETWAPRFTYQGFRYVELNGYPGIPQKDDFTGCLVYDDMKTVGTFESSNSLLNQIFKNSWWGIASNYKGMPIDCPQRNERQPWLGDRTVGAYGESFLFDNTAMYKKWLDDIRYAQKEDGAIPDVAPAFWRYYSDNVTWPATLLMISDMLYKQTGDVTILIANYPAIKKWMGYMKDRYMNNEGIMTKDSYGDWCAPPLTAEDGKGVNADQKHPSALIATAYYYHLATMMTRYSALTVNGADSAGYAALASELKKAFNSKFYNDQGYYGDNKLTDNLLPVYFGIVDEGNKKKVIKQICSIIEEKNNGHLSTGLIGTQFLMRTLTEVGRSDLAYRIASQKTYPSWGYMIENGATAIWELWNGNTAAPKMNSQNHVMMLGDLLIWYYENLAGIKAAAPGFKEIVMKPEMIEGLDKVNATYQSVYGPIISSWAKTSGKFSWNISIPPNTTAKISIPAKYVGQVKESGQKATDVKGVKFIHMEAGRAVCELGSGDYTFTAVQ